MSDHASWAARARALHVASSRKQRWRHRPGQSRYHNATTVPTVVLSTGESSERRCNSHGDDLQRLHALQDHGKANEVYARLHCRFRRGAIHIAGCPTATPARLAFLVGSEGYLVGWGVEGVSKTRLSDAMSSSEHAVTVPKKESGMACR